VPAFQRALAPIAVLLSAALLFWIQPLHAARLLPWFGGSPGTWTLSLLLFQSLLVLAYAYAHLMRGRRLWPHFLLWGLGSVLLSLQPEPPDPAQLAQAPLRFFLLLSLKSVTFPFLLLATTAPLVQARFAQLRGRRVYRLYAWSNLGATLALLSYPLFLDPNLGLSAQTQLWEGLFWLLALLLFLLLWPHRGASPAQAQCPTLALKSRLLWMLLAGCGTGLLAALTESMTQDLSLGPLLWTLPLLLYLLSFVLAFGRPAWSSPRIFGPLGPLALLALLWAQHQGWRLSWPLQLGLNLSALFILCSLLHGSLARRAPPPEQLSRFYLDVALGGALGTLCVALLGPALLPLPMELHFFMLLSALLLSGLLLQWLKRRPFGPPLGGVALLLFLSLLGLVWGLGTELKRRASKGRLYRSFYGSLQLRDYPPSRRGPAVRNLRDGRISHGFEYVDPELRGRTTSYFTPGTGVGRLLSAPSPPRRVAVLGLGIGTLAAYARPGDEFSFFELNPQVIQIAQEHFHFLKECDGALRLLEGDARLSLQVEEDSFSHLILDAFSGDALPRHLLTREAMQLYLSKLDPKGVLAVNVSNRHLDLSRVLRGHADQLQLEWRWVRHQEKSRLGIYRSDWMLLSRDLMSLAPILEAASSLPSLAHPPVDWSDEQAAILPLLW